MTDEEHGALRASAALWAGTSVLIADQRGGVLIQRVDYRTTCLLPGGAVDESESPAHGAARELREELGVTMTVDRGLAVDWVSADSINAPADMRFPGEILHVYDGGTWDKEQIAAIRLPDREIKSVEFVEPARLPDLMSPGDARRALSALRARINSAGAALLENGLPIAPTVLDRAGALRTARTRPPPLPHRPRPSAAPGGPGLGLAPRARRPSLGASGTGHRRGLPSRRHPRPPGPRQPARHTAPGGTRGSRGRVRRTAAPRPPLRPRQAVRPPPLHRAPHPSWPATRRPGHRPHPHPGPRDTRAGPGALRLGTPGSRPARRRPPGPRGSGSPVPRRSPSPNCRTPPASPPCSPPRPIFKRELA
ncbi:NUDIX hydrolase [Streptomyces sp. NPDC006458]|uniref:NUDIX hydrolase n=1 Tax=Streptomyces sp. NPDC006458 TaxID=3154302 RepID=UPI0033B3264F